MPKLWAMDTDPSPAASTSTLDPAPPVEAGWSAPPQRSAGASALRSAGGLLRWLLFAVLVVVAPIALTIWTVMPRVTNLEQLAEQAVDTGMTAVVRDAFVDQLADRLAERRNAPAAADQMRPIFERSLTQAWFDEQVVGVASEVERWFAGTDQAAPDLVIDLVPVKASLVADPLALAMVAELIECEGCPAEDQSSISVLQQVPDELSLVSTEGEGAPDEMLQARDTLNNGRRARDLIPVVLLASMAMIVLLARHHTRLRWAGYTALAAAIPLLLVALLAPGAISQQAAGALPSEFPVQAAHIEGVADWMFAPAQSLALWLMVAGLALVAASVTSAVVRRRQYR